VRSDFSVRLNPDKAYEELKREIEQGKVVINKSDDDGGVLNLAIDYPPGIEPSRFEAERHVKLLYNAAMVIVEKDRERRLSKSPLELIRNRRFI
jgi:hypothetical protein